MYLLQYGYEELNLNRLQIRIGTGNVPSNRVAEKLGFKHEGILRDGELLVSGYTDLNILVY